jgi:hypothetical protein
MIWNDAYMYECPAEFRFFWLRNSLEELGAGADSGNGAGWRGHEDCDNPVDMYSDGERASGECESFGVSDGAGDTRDARDRGGDIGDDVCGDDSIERCVIDDGEVDAVDVISVAPRRRNHGANEGGSGAYFYKKNRTQSHRKTPWLRFQPVPFYDADAPGVSAAADTTLTAAAGIENQDGLLFYMKEAHYELGLTAVVLAWKDDSTSQHTIETFPEPGPPHTPASDLPLVTTLAHRPSTDSSSVTQLLTCDSPPIVLADVPTTELVDAVGPSLPSRLVRARITNTACVAGGATPELEPIGVAGPNRATPDSWSRVMFQCKSRHCPVTLDDLVHAPPGDDMDDEDAPGIAVDR